MFPRLNSHLGGAEPACADVTSPEHLLVAQDTAAGVLLVVQELLEGAESALGLRGAGNLLQQPADLVWIVFHLEMEEEEDMTGRDGDRGRELSGEMRLLIAHPHADITHCFTLTFLLYISEDLNDSTSI